MARAAPVLPISPKLFRHFAAVTVVFTICVAMFADGEGREAVAAQIEERQKQNELLLAEAKTVGQRKIGLKEIKASKGAIARANASLDETESADSFGAPMDTGDGSSTGIGGGDMPAAVGPRGQRAEAGRSMVLPPHLRGKQSNLRKPGTNQPQRPTQAQLNGLIAASRQRSGAAN